MTAEPVLQVEGLSVSYRTRHSVSTVVDDVSFDAYPGEILGLVGGSGSGKTTTLRAVLGRVPRGAVVDGGTIRLGGVAVPATARRARAQQAGTAMSVIVQNPANALSPLHSVQYQMRRLAEGRGKSATPEQLKAVLTDMGIADSKRVLGAYPHELSGGLAQRVLLGIAVLLEPTLLLADEPTSSLDVTIQAQIIELVQQAVQGRGLSVVLVTHDIALVKQCCERVVVLERGRVVESGKTRDVLAAPAHRYTRSLVSSARVELARTPSVGTRPVVEMRDVCKTFHSRHGQTGALDHVDLEVPERSTLALVGESGSGKSTLARVVLGLTTPDTGAVKVNGFDVTRLTKDDTRRFRGDAQVVLQDPFGSLNPRMRVRQILTEPIILGGERSKQVQRRKVTEALDQVRLGPAFLDRFPGELSGGEQQRVGIARAIIRSPKLIVLDEPTAALDAEVRKGIYELLAEIQQRLGLTYLLISHDLVSVRAVSDLIAVMHKGRIVESGTTEEVFSSPRHPYTLSLLSAAPSLDAASSGPGRLVLAGEDRGGSSEGCHLAGRCPLTSERCTTSRPPLSETAGSHLSACWRSDDMEQELSGSGQPALSRLDLE